MNALTSTGLAFLAQTPPPPDSYAGIGWLVVGLGALALALNQLDEFAQRRKERPSATEVQQHAAERYATLASLDAHVLEDKETHQHLEQQIKAVADGLSGFQSEVQKKGDERRKSIEDKLEASHTQLFTLISKRDESTHELAVNVAKLNATLAAWKEAPPWKNHA